MQAWAGLWRAHQAVKEVQGSFVQDSLDDAPLPALMVQDIRACLAQPAGQWKGVDSWTGAELKSLPLVALQGLVHLYGRFEALGSFPPGAQCVLEVLLDKGVGGSAFEPKKHWHAPQGLPSVVAEEESPSGLEEGEELDLGMRHWPRKRSRRRCLASTF